MESVLSCICCVKYPGVETATASATTAAAAAATTTTTTTTIFVAGFGALLFLLLRAALSPGERARTLANELQGAELGVGGCCRMLQAFALRAEVSPDLSFGRDWP